MSTEQQTQEAPRFTSMRQVRQANKAIGHVWFSESTMRYWQTQIASDGLFGGRYFISSERLGTSRSRAYTIREAQADGSIDTVGDFQGYPTLAAARNAVRALVDGTCEGGC